MLKLTSRPVVVDAVVHVECVQVMSRVTLIVVFISVSVECLDSRSKNNVFYCDFFHQVMSLEVNCALSGDNSTRTTTVTGTKVEEKNAPKTSSSLKSSSSDIVSSASGDVIHPAGGIAAGALGSSSGAGGLISGGGNVHQSGATAFKAGKAGKVASVVGGEAGSTGFSAGSGAGASGGECVFKFLPNL